MLRRHTITLLMLGSLLVAICFSAPALGRTGMVNMLNLTGARQAAMGETAPANDLDPFNLEYNPASIVGMTKGRVGFSHNSFIQDRTTNAVAAIFPAWGLDFGVHMRISGVDDIEARDETPSSEPLYLFNAHDVAVKLFSAFRITDRLQAGVSAGWLMEKIDTERGSAGAFGLGVQYRFDRGITAYGSMANIGPDFSFVEEENDLPAIYRTGVSYHREMLTVSADYVNVKSGDSHLHFGGEYLVREVLFLRAGYQTGYDSRDLSAGTGFVYKNWRIDYAFVPYQSDLGNSHRFTLTYAVR